MRILELSPAAAQKARKVVEHAKKRKNWYDPVSPGWLNRIPGQDRRYQCMLNSFRCVFSYTLDRKKAMVMRHLSISVPSGKFPHPMAVKEIGVLFGFTEVTDSVPGGFPQDWLVMMKNDGPIDDRCIVVAQDAGIKP
jgi:hypothetical protein